MRMHNKTQGLLPALMAALAVIGSVGAAHANPGNPPVVAANSVWDYFGTDYGDAYTSVFLNQIFGPLFPSATGAATATLFPVIMSYFNSIVLLVGSLMFFYNFTVGVLQSAHEGKILGQRWSSLWAPIRIIFAVGMLVPVNHGYNLAQSGVAFIVKGSTQMATAIWGTSADLILTGDVPIAVAPATVSPDTMRTMFKNASCMVAMGNEAAHASPQNQMLYVPMDPNTTRIQAAQGGGYGPTILNMVGQTIRTEGQVNMTTAYVQNGEISAAGICGSYTTPALPDYIKERIASNAVDANRAMEIQAVFGVGHAAIMNELNTSMMAVASRLYSHVDNVDEPTPLDISADIIRIHQKANDDLATLNEAIRTSFTNDNTIRQQLSDRITGGAQCTNGVNGNDVNANRASVAGCYGEGWLGAGSWYILLARLNNELNSLISAASTVTGPNYTSESFGTTQSWWWPFGEATNQVELRRGSSMEEIGQNIQKMDASFFSSTVRLAAMGYAMDTETVALLTAKSGDSWGFFDGSLRDEMLGLTKILLDFFDPGGNGADPMIGLISTGNTMIMTAAGAFALLAGAGGILGSLPFVGGVVELANTLLMPAFSIVLAAGTTLSFVLPMMPFFIWIMAVTGYFLLVVEAVVAVNLWALSHLRMDGEGLSGEAGARGWLMVLALFFTPTLMIFGYLIGMIIFRITSDLISGGMFYAVSAVMGASFFSWLVGLLAFSVMICTIYIFVLDRSFALIAEFPNRVMAWMGSNVSIVGGEQQARMAAAASAMAINSGGNVLEKHAFSRRATEGADGKTNYQIGGAAGGIRQGLQAGRNGIGRVAGIFRGGSRG